MNPKTIELCCAGCNKMFFKNYAEYKRRFNKKKNKFYCSYFCFTTTDGKHNRINGMPINQRTQFTVKELDELSPFRYYKPNSYKINKYGDTDITLKYLKELWDKQNGICPYTGIKMVLPSNKNDIHKFPLCTSLDRINHKMGYIQGNVEFVCLAINYAKNTFSKLQIKEFVDKIKVVEVLAAKPDVL